MDRRTIQERFGIIGSSAALRHVIDRARMVARTDISALIQGESGVGKELIARLIHDLSPRRHADLVTVNCGAIPEGLIESELFGAEKGAYTGSSERRIGFFEAADEGTIFLDEIGEMPLQAQVRLLRVLETGAFSRVGSSKELRTDVRVVAATNKDLAQEVQAGRFREDLYYRLSTVVIDIPPLRERSDDVLELFRTFLHRFTQAYNTPSKRLTPAAEQLLLAYRWPGNIRELRNVAERSTVLVHGETVDVDALRPFLRGVDLSGGSQSLVPLSAARSASGGGGPETRERELVYRALLELRLEVREMKEQLEVLTAAPQRPRPVPQAPEGFDEASRDFVIVSDKNDLASVIEDVVYEIEQENASTVPPPSRTLPASTEAAAPVKTFPTLEEQEQRLIAEALDYFEGNRRQTAQALGISERTLYRKIKEL
ncbi:MAG: sigma 54-interacting transcriptional regulator [Bacteroidota bacterium]